MEGGRRPYAWPEDTDFALWELDVLDRDCPFRGHMMYVCDHRYRRVHTLDGPVQLVCKLNHCPDPRCLGHAKTKSPELEVTIARPQWAIGRDVFCWIGHRRYARHRSTSQIQSELWDEYGVKISDDSIARYIGHYQVMLAARQQAPEALRRQYDSVGEIILSIDGLQPEKGHETLYVVRELTQKRVWFAEPLISATADEVRRLIKQARAWAESLGKPVVLWLSDRQDAFVTGIAAEFPDVPHRYCDNQFRRDVAKPVLEADSHSKVAMRKKVRGLRTIDQAVLRRQGAAEPKCPAPVDREATTPVDVGPMETPACGADADPAGAVVLAYPRGGAWHSQRRSRRTAAPSWLADGRGVERSPRVDPAKRCRAKRGFAEQQLGRLAGCIDRGLEEVRDQHAAIRKHVKEVKDVKEVAATLEPGARTCAARQRTFEELIDRFARSEDPIHRQMVQVMTSFLAGLFVGEGTWEQIRDNLEWERWFRLPKSHERRIRGHRHAGIRIVLEGPTLMHALDAHAAHPGPFTADDLLPHRAAQEPRCQEEALNRRKIMR